VALSHLTAAFRLSERDTESGSLRLPSTRRTARVAAYTTAAGLALLAAAGCGGTSQSAGVAQVSSTGSKSAKTQKPFTATAADKLAFSRCMRSHGVPNWPDPINGHIGFLVKSGIDPESPTVKAAYNLCGTRFLGFTQATPAEMAQGHARALRYSLCMRSHGASDFPDPSATSEGEIDIKTSNYWESPVVQRADQTCKSLRSQVAIVTPTP
jgi:hypothetical protein